MPKYRNHNIPDELVLLASNQAAYIHQREEIVQAIVEEAVQKLRVTATQQRKRLFADIQHATRIYLKDMHLLQYLVLYHSERHEKTQEAYAPGSISEKDMITRYIAYIVRMTMKTNSLYGVTGVCRFICHYELKTVRRIHEALLDEPELYKTDDDFRNNRMKMRNMIFQRFAKYLRLTESPRGHEKHFQLRENQNELSLLRLVWRSLNAFTPWHTKCLPTDFNPDEDKRGTFRHHDEHVCEIRRLHTLIHPDCFKALTSALHHVDMPDTRLGIPQFFSVKSIDGMPFSEATGDSSAISGNDGSHYSNTVFTDERKLATFKKKIAEQDERLEKFVPVGTLTVKIDAEDVAYINLDATNRVQFVLDHEESELIEIVAQSENLVLAAHILDDEVWQSRKRKHFYTVQHNNGAKLTFIIRRPTNVAAGNNHLLVTVIYKETNPVRALAFLQHRAGNRLAVTGRAIEKFAGSLLPPKPTVLTTAGNNMRLSRLIFLLLLTASIGVCLSALLSLRQSSLNPSGSNSDVISISKSSGDERREVHLEEEQPSVKTNDISEALPLPRINVDSRIKVKSRVKHNKANRDVDPDNIARTNLPQQFGEKPDTVISLGQSNIMSEGRIVMSTPDPIEINDCDEKYSHYLGAKGSQCPRVR